MHIFLKSSNKVDWIYWFLLHLGEEKRTIYKTCNLWIFNSKLLCISHFIWWISTENIGYLPISIFKLNCNLWESLLCHYAYLLCCIFKLSKKIYGRVNDIVLGFQCDAEQKLWYSQDAMERVSTYLAVQTYEPDNNGNEAFFLHEWLFRGSSNSHGRAFALGDHSFLCWIKLHIVSISTDLNSDLNKDFSLHPAWAGLWILFTSLLYNPPLPHSPVYTHLY